MNNFIENLKKINKWKIVGIYFIFTALANLIFYFAIMQAAINIVYGIFLFKENEKFKKFFGIYLLAMIIFSSVGFIILHIEKFNNIKMWLELIALEWVNIFLLFYLYFTLRREQKNKYETGK